MKNIVLFNSKHNNNYLYNTYTKSVYYLNKIMFAVVSSLEQGMNKDEITNDFLLQRYNIKTSEFLLNVYKSKADNYIKGDPLKNYNTLCIEQISEDFIKYQIANKPQVVFGVTESCNLKCHYCGYGDLYNWYDPRHGNDLDTNTAKLLIQYILNMRDSKHCITPSQEFVIGFYGGEPLLRFDFIKEIVLFTKTLCSENLFFTFKMTTNAVFLGKYMDFLAEHNFKLLISLDGDRKHNSYRVFHNGKESFPLVFKNIKQLKEKHPYYFKEHVSINSVLHNRNSKQKIRDFIIKNFEKEPSLADISTQGLDETKKEIISQLFQNKKEQLHQSEDYFGENSNIEYLKIDSMEVARFMIYQTNRIYPNLVDLYANQNRPIKPTGTCVPFSRKLYITATGKILPCENTPHQYSMGHVSVDDVIIDFKSIADQYNAYMNKVSPLCNSCYRITHCMQCMFSMNLGANKVRCYGYTTKAMFSTYLSNVFSYMENNPEQLKQSESVIFI